MKNQYGILIRVCWIVLVCCFIVKIFGGNYFEIALNNEKFIAFCYYVDDHIYLKMFLALIMYMFSTSLYLCIVLKEKMLSKKHLLIFVPLMVIKSLLGWYNYWLAFCIDFIIALFIPYFINNDVKHTIVAYIILNVFQLISLGIINIGFGNFNSNFFLIQTIMQIDYYIMLSLYYLYYFKNKKEL